MKCIGKPICLTKLIHKCLFVLKKVRVKTIKLFNFIIYDDDATLETTIEIVIRERTIHQLKLK